MSFQVYVAVSWVASFLLLMALPTRLSPWRNFTGSVLASMFGFILWPAFVAAFVVDRYRARKEASYDTRGEDRGHQDAP